MMRGIFTTPGATPDQVAFYSELLDRVRAQPEWQEFLVKGAFKSSAMAGEPFSEWLDKASSYHNVLMREAKLKAAPGALAVVPVAAGAAAPVATRN